MIFNYVMNIKFHWFINTATQCPNHFYIEILEPKRVCKLFHYNSSTSSSQRFSEILFNEIIKTSRNAFGMPRLGKQGFVR